MQNNQVYAGFFVRLTAYLLDRLILCIPLLLIRLLIWLFVQNIFYRGLHTAVFFRFSPTDIILYIAGAAYFVILTYFWGRTPGKRLMKLKVVSSEDRKPTFFEIFFRETFGRFLSSAILCIGYFIIGAGDQKQALHDYLADTRVVYDMNEGRKGSRKGRVASSEGETEEGTLDVLGEEETGEAEEAKKEAAEALRLDCEF